MQHILSEQLDDTDNDAVLEEFHALELNVLGSEAAALPSVPTTRVQEEVGQALETSVLTSSSTQQQKQQQQLDVEEELPSPPSTKVSVAGMQVHLNTWHCRYRCLSLKLRTQGQACLHKVMSSSQQGEASHRSVTIC